MRRLLAKNPRPETGGVPDSTAKGRPSSPRRERRFACSRPNTALLRLMEHEKRHGGYESTFRAPDGTVYLRQVNLLKKVDRWFRLGQRSPGAAE